MEICTYAQIFVSKAAYRMLQAFCVLLIVIFYYYSKFSFDASVE